MGRQGHVGGHVLSAVHEDVGRPGKQINGGRRGRFAAGKRRQVVMSTCTGRSIDGLLVCSACLPGWLCHVVAVVVLACSCLLIRLLYPGFHADKQPAASPLVAIINDFSQSMLVKILCSCSMFYTVQSLL